MPLQNGGNGRRANRAYGLLRTLVVDEEEDVVSNDRAAQSCSILIPAELGLSLAHGSKIVSGIQTFIAKELVNAAVKPIGSASRGKVDYSSVEPAELGRNPVGLDVEFLNRIDNREKHDLSWFWVQSTDSVEQVGLMAEVKLSIGDQRINSIITASSAREMNLKPGQTAAALIKATEVMILRL